VSRSTTWNSASSIGAAQTLDCEKVDLDNGLSNGLAHRLYFRQGMLATALRSAILYCLLLRPDSRQKAFGARFKATRNFC